MIARNETVKSLKWILLSVKFNLNLWFNQSLNANDEDSQIIESLSSTKASLTSSLTDVNEDLINEKNNEIGRVTKWAIGFEKLLQDPLGLQIFTVIFCYFVSFFDFKNWI